MPTPSRPGRTRKPGAWAVRESLIHGKGVFATRPIAPGERIIEYKGERISWPEALRRAERNGGPLNHTFFFTLSDGRVIDGGSQGNAARFINHSCEPNCEAMEHEDGRVYIYSLRHIDAGEELSYHYALIYEGRHTAAVKRAFACHCGAPSCPGVMLAPKRRAARKASA
ncbi:SET domain-containing protein [Noviherbaspirillum massiliense]|uniref:SET domain-containing protein n=1 Tax=Noviherbaspirillum massiliense TaxID=1465823 RepID=UPI0004750040|nr:SET domain-containing protein-lysine N-methyltransferase [Noviherbaspirillum massiliense]